VQTSTALGFYLALETLGSLNHQTAFHTRLSPHTHKTPLIDGPELYGTLKINKRTYEERGGGEERLKSACVGAFTLRTQACLTSEFGSLGWCENTSLFDVRVWFTWLV